MLVWGTIFTAAQSLANLEKLCNTNISLLVELHWFMKQKRLGQRHLKGFSSHFFTFVKLFPLFCQSWFPSPLILAISFFAVAFFIFSLENVKLTVAHRKGATLCPASREHCVQLHLPLSSVLSLFFPRCLISGSLVLSHPTGSSLFGTK